MHPDWQRRILHEEARQAAQRTTSADRRAALIADAVDAADGQKPVADALGVSVAALSKTLATARRRSERARLATRGADYVELDLPHAGLRVPTDDEWTGLRRDLSPDQLRQAADRASLTWHAMWVALHDQGRTHLQRTDLVLSYLRRVGPDGYEPDPDVAPDQTEAARLIAWLGILPDREHAEALIAVHRDLAASCDAAAADARDQYYLWHDRLDQPNPHNRPARDAPYGDESPAWTKEIQARALGAAERLQAYSNATGAGQLDDAELRHLNLVAAVGADVAEITRIEVTGTRRTRLVNVAVRAALDLLNHDLRSQGQRSFGQDHPDWSPNVAVRGEYLRGYARQQWAAARQPLDVHDAPLSS